MTGPLSYARVAGRTIAERLEARLVDQPNGCREFDGSRTKGGSGYAQIKVDGRSIYVHRLAWELANGPIPPGIHVLHHCDNPPCCQTDPTPGYPDGHLFLGTPADNSADMMAKGRHNLAGPALLNRKKTHCMHGHPFDQVNTYFDALGQRHCQVCLRAVRLRRVKKWGGNQSRTHCPQGHPYDAANTYVTPNGWRQCRTCRRDANRRARIRAAS